MSYFEDLVSGLASDLTHSHRYNYSQQSLQQWVVSNPTKSVRRDRVQNKRGEELQTMILRQGSHDTCIIYAHGLGSNRLQALPLAKHFTFYDICSFDFSGSGRSQGRHTGYGLLQQDDVDAILMHLDQAYHYHKYILWGRSMGGVSIIMSQGNKMHWKVKGIVIDSAFSSFEKIAVELVSKKSYVPQFMLGFIIQPLKLHLIKNKMVNPFQMNIIDKIKNISTKVYFIYSKSDSVVNHHHTLALMQECRNPIDLQIKEDHNEERTIDTFRKVQHFILTCIQDYQRKNKRNSLKKGRGISLTSKDQKQLSKKETRNTVSKLTLLSSKYIPKSRESKTKEPSRTRVLTIRSIQTQQDYHQKIKINNISTVTYSPINVKKIYKINSILQNPSFALPDKENRCSNINLMRRNRFR